MNVPPAHASCIIVAWSKAAKLPTPQPSTISSSTSSKRYATTAEITTARDIVIMHWPPSPRYVSAPVTSTQFPGAEMPPATVKAPEGSIGTFMKKFRFATISRFLKVRLRRPNQARPEWQSHGRYFIPDLHRPVGPRVAGAETRSKQTLRSRSPPRQTRHRPSFRCS
jgi:hypothetical protein